MPTILRIYGQPGSGKSTLAHYVAAHLAARGHVVEVVQDVARIRHRAGIDLNANQKETILEQFEVARNAQRADVDFVVDEAPMLALAAFAKWKGNEEAETLAVSLHEVLDAGHLADTVNVFLKPPPRWESRAREQIDAMEAAKVGDLTRALTQGLPSMHVFNGHSDTSRQLVLQLLQDVLQRAEEDLVNLLSTRPYDAKGARNTHP